MQGKFHEIFLSTTHWTDQPSIFVINKKYLESYLIQGAASQSEEKQQGDAEGWDPVHEQLLGGEQGQDQSSGRE